MAGDDVVMVGGVEGVSGRRSRRFRTVTEKRRIAELTLEPGASVALVARAEGVNANQVFKWRRALKRGELNESASGSTTLLPVMLPGPSIAPDTRDHLGAEQQPARCGSIHIELPGRAMISVEHGADPLLLSSILESLRK